MGCQDSVGEGFVDRYLETGIVAVADIDELLKCKAREGHRLEFKGGTWLADKANGPVMRGNPVKPGPRLCKYAAGFANAAGGVLVVGINEDAVARDVAGSVDSRTCREFARTIEGLAQQATEALRPVAAQMAEPPRISTVDHPDGWILVIGVYRSPTFVECHEPGGLPLYYLRTFDGTSAVPDILAADLLLGRRSHPDFRLMLKLGEPQVKQDVLHLRATLIIRNESLVWAPSVRAGCVQVSAAQSGRPAAIASGLAAAVESPTPDRLVHQQANEANYTWRELPPFEEVTAYLPIKLPIGENKWSFATYVVAPGHPPSWWETTGWINASPSPRLNQEVTTERCNHRRPQVFVERRHT